MSPPRGASRSNRRCSFFPRWDCRNSAPGRQVGMLCFVMRPKYVNFVIRYSVAVISILLTLVIKLLLKNYLEIGGEEREAPFMLSLAAVMVSGWYGGLGPGLAATV